MAYMNATTALDSPASIRSFLSGIVTRFVRHRTYRLTLNALTKLSDHDLNDVGLSRHDLHRVALEAAKR